MIDLQVLTRLWPETFATDTGALRELLIAGWSTELGGRATDIEDVALELLILRDLLRLREDAFVGAALHDTPLMHGEGAEIALAEAAAGLGDAFLDLTEGRDAARRIVHRMPRTHERKRVDVIHLELGERCRRRVLHDEHRPIVALVDTLCDDRICVPVLDGEALRVLSLIAGDLLIVREADGIVDLILVACFIDGTGDPGDVLHLETGVQGICDLNDAVLAHTVGQKVGTTVEEHGTAYAVGPVVIVCETAQARLDTADDDRSMLIAFPYQITVDRHRAVRTLSHDAARCIGVGLSMMLRDGVVIHHGIHVAAGHEEAESRLPELHHGRRIVPVRLRQHRDLIAVCLEHTGDDGGPEAGVVHIGVTHHIDEIRLCPATLQHILPVDR